MIVRCAYFNFLSFADVDLSYIELTFSTDLNEVTSGFTDIFKVSDLNSFGGVKPNASAATTLVLVELSKEKTIELDEIIYIRRLIFLEPI